MVVHLFAGPRRRCDVQEFVEAMAAEHELDLLMLSVDLLVDANWDLSEPSTFSSLMSLVAEGLIDVIIGGFPCSTWSRARHNYLPGGPRPVRLRGRYCWGVPWLTPKESQRVAEGNVLAMNSMALCEGVSSRGGGHALEHPDDPDEYPYASIWDTEEMTGMELRTGSARHRCHQCMRGGPAVKPTCISGTLDGLDSPGLLCDGSHQHERAYGLAEQGGFRSAPLARYPAGLCEFLATCIIKTLLRFRASGSGPTGWLRTNVKTLRVSHWSQCTDRHNHEAVAILNEESVRGRCVVLRKGQSAGYLHVDDGVIISSRVNKDGCNRTMNKCADALQNAGFTVVDRTLDSALERIVGYEPRRHPARLQLPARKATLLVDSIRYLTRMQPVNVDWVRSVLGVWIWGALLKRELLAIPQAVFGFVEKLAGQTAPWWPTARREMILMSNAVSSMYADLGANLATTAFATDAMGAGDLDCGGYGVVTASCEEETVVRCFEEGLEPGFAVCRLDGSFRGMARPERSIGRNVPFTQVPPEFLACDWKPLLWGRWDRADHITLGEGRSVIKLLALLCADERAHRHRVFSLQDNRPIAGSFAKGRSTSTPLNRICRMRTAYTVASEIQLLLPWVQSDRMPADWLSRQIDGPGSVEHKDPKKPLRRLDTPQG